MHKHQGICIIVLTACVILFLSFFVGFTIRSVDQKVTEYCFEELANTTKRLAAELKQTADMDQTVLSAMAEVITGSSRTDDEELCRIMRAYNTAASYVSYVELLRPDNTLLDTDGTVRDVSGSFDFARDAARGAHISDRQHSTRDTKEYVVRNAVPVVKNGKTIYILYGVIRLSDVAKTYTTDIYDGHAYVYLEDGATGDYLLDTWHQSFGDIRDLGKRTMLPGYDLEKDMALLEQGKSGSVGFISKTTGGVLYLHHEPVGINRWNVMVSIEQRYAMQQSQTVNTILYRMAVVIGVVTLVYMGCILYWIFVAYRNARHLGMVDQTTGLRNRNAYDRFITDNRQTVFPSLVCVFVDANGLHDINNRFGHVVGDQMLRLTADALKAAFPEASIYRIGGDEFVVFCTAHDGEFCTRQMEQVVCNISAHDYSVSFGIVFHENEMGVDRITKEADDKMLEDKRAYYAAGHNRRH